MSGKLNLPHCRKFKPRISQEELRRLASDRMQESGANNHFQSVYYKENAKVVVGSKNPHFAVIQPTIKPHDEEAWATAYEFVFDFLKEYQMNETADTMNIEFTATQKPHLTDTFEETSRNDYFQDLLAFTKEPIPFEDRVEEFAEQEQI